MSDASPVITPRISVLDAQGQYLQTIDLNVAVLTIGRQPTNGLVLDDEAVARNHLRIDRDGERVSVTDLGSRGGTMLDGVRLSPRMRQAWSDQSVLQVGPFQLRLELASASTRAGSSKTPSGMFAVPAVAGYEFFNASRIDVMLESGKDRLLLMPGQPQMIKVTLCNRGDEPRALDLVVDGAPSDWVQVSAPTMMLEPGEQTVATLQVLAPRASESAAGEYLVTVSVRDQATQEELGAVTAEWTMAPFAGGSMTISPRNGRGRQSAAYKIGLLNSGNEPMSYNVRAEDDDRELDYQFSQTQVHIAPGQTTRVDLTVYPRGRLWFRTQHRSFSVRAAPLGDGDAQVITGTLVQLPVFSRALIASLVSLLLLLLVCGLGTFPVMAGLPGYGFLKATPTVSEAEVPTTTPTITPTPANAATATAQAYLAATAQVEAATATWMQGDDDRDKLTNGDELALRTNPTNRDTDGDKLSDGEEVDRGTDPLNPDTDGDGVRDRDELGRGTDPLNPDTDGDGIPDGQEGGNFPTPFPTGSSGGVQTPTSATGGSSGGSGGSSGSGGSGQTAQPAASTTATAAPTTSGGGATATATATPVLPNEAPVLSVPGALTIAEDGDLSIVGLTVSDKDAGNGALLVTFSVSKGRITIQDITGLAIKQGENSSAQVTVEGRLSAINAALSQVIYHGNANYNGADVLSINVDDQGNSGTGGAKSDRKTIAITITKVNDPPAFTVNPAPANTSVDEDSGAKNIGNWVTSKQPGPVSATDEVSQSLSFDISNNTKPTLFSELKISKEGVISFTPAADQYGEAVLTIVLHDDGAGNDTSAPQQLTIEVKAVNDPPSFEKGADVEVDEDSGVYNKSWATKMSPGPNEGSQGWEFKFGYTNSGLFDTIEISTSGILIFTPKNDMFGSSTITVWMIDTSSEPGFVSAKSSESKFVITVNPVNDAPSFYLPKTTLCVTKTNTIYTFNSWAQNISSGPNESDNLIFDIVQNSDTSIFKSSSQPSINATGTLSFQTKSSSLEGSSTIIARLNDRQPTNNFSAEHSFDIFVDTNNNAPVLTPSGDIDLSPISISERGSIGGTTTNLTTILVRDIVNLLDISDPDAYCGDDHPGIAISSIDSAKGTWYYKIPSGNWNPITPKNPSAIRLLAADNTTKIGFVVGSGKPGDTSSITFHAWDARDNNGLAIDPSLYPETRSVNTATAILTLAQLLDKAPLRVDLNSHSGQAKALPNNTLVPSSPSTNFSNRSTTSSYALISDVDHTNQRRYRHWNSEYRRMQ